MWLNNPRRPLEASGTSGQKVVLNGGLNLSILDGWWAEAYDGRNGFAIGGGETHSAVDITIAATREALLKVLRDEVVPLYYDRDVDGLPRAWISRMKRAIRTLGWRFSASRMVRRLRDPVLYIPAAGGTSCDMKRGMGRGWSSVHAPDVAALCSTFMPHLHDADAKPGLDVADAAYTAVFAAAPVWSWVGIVGGRTEVMTCPAR